MPGWLRVTSAVISLFWIGVVLASPYPVQIQTPLVTAASVQAQINAATANLASQSALSIVQAAIPAPCATLLPPDTLLGATGSGTPCSTRPDSTRPTNIQAAIVTTDASGNWSVTWAKAFTSSTPYINPQAINVAGAQPYICNVATSSTTTATGKCWQTLTMTLPSVALSLLGLVLNPTGAASSIQVRVAARDSTQ